jgi:PAS domain S-box-containing protein
MREITERKKTSHELQWVNEQLQISIDQMPVGYILWDRAFRVLEWNHAAEKIFGYLKSEVLGKYAADFIVPVDKRYKVDEVIRYLQEGKVSSYSGKDNNIRKDGKLISCQWHNTPLKDMSGETCGILSMVEDITERHHKDQELKKYGTLFENISDLAYICDTEGNVLFLNKVFEELSGHKPDEFIGKSFAPLFEGEDLEKAKDLYLRTLNGESPQQEVRFKVTGKLCEYKNFPLRGETGEIIGVLGTARDITERKQMEEALLQSEKLKSIGTITTGIAHEFNNILAIISGNVQLMEEIYKDHTELRKALSTIKMATADGTEISRKMLRFTKARKITTEFVSCDIRDLIRQSIDFTMPRWKSMAQSKGINYHIDTKNINEVPLILCNPAELREIIINIINNAIDAMPDGGRLSFGTWSKENTIFMNISDTGEGMSYEVKKRIFDPFFTTKLAIGTGLGMSITYGIITGHGGKIDVESEEGKGTTFTLQFPVTATVKSDILKGFPEQKQEIKYNNLRILVVDDEKEVCNMLERCLSSNGYYVKTVNSGAEALELARKEVFHLVLCDMVMPNVNGYDVIKALNELKKKPKIGMITGWGEKLKPINKSGLSVDFILKKPFEFSALLKKIDQVFVVA